MQSERFISAELIVAMFIQANALQSLNYDPPDGGETFADAGTRFDLANGNLISRAITVDAGTGAVSARNFSVRSSGTQALIAQFAENIYAAGDAILGFVQPPFGAGDASGAIGKGLNADARTLEMRQQVNSNAIGDPLARGRVIVQAPGGTSGRADMVATVESSAWGVQTSRAFVTQADNAQGQFWVHTRFDTARFMVQDDSVNVYNNVPLRFITWGGGWFMQDATYLRAWGDKFIWTQGGGIGCGSTTTGFTQGLNAAYAFGSGPLNGSSYVNALAGSLGVNAALACGTLTAAGGTPGGVAGVFTNSQIISNYAQQNIGAARPWNVMHIRAQSQGGGGNNSAGFVAWVPGIAPVWDTFETGGERWRAINNPNTAHIPIEASAFTVISTARAKADITAVPGAELLERISRLDAHRYRFKVRPQTLRPSPRFADVNARWTARGRTPLTVQPHHTESHDHDCSVDTCAGDADHPCMITANDTERFGLIAEQVYEVAPEVVHLDPDLRPLGVDVDQVAALALAGVAALTRELAALRRELQSRP